MRQKSSLYRNLYFIIYKQTQIKKNSIYVKFASTKFNKMRDTTLRFNRQKFKNIEAEKQIKVLSK